MNIGYARVSTQDQNLDLQLDELKHIVRKGDQGVVWKLDRLGRSLRDLIDLINYFDNKGVEFQSIQG